VDLKDPRPALIGSGGPEEWRVALDMLLAELLTGTWARELTLRLDNGCQPTSNRFQDTLKTYGCTLSGSATTAGYISLDYAAKTDRK